MIGILFHLLTNDRLMRSVGILVVLAIVGICAYFLWRWYARQKTLQGARQRSLNAHVTSNWEELGRLDKRIKAIEAQAGPALTDKSEPDAPVATAAAPERMRVPATVSVPAQFVSLLLSQVGAQTSPGKVQSAVESARTLVQDTDASVPDLPRVVVD
jgi:hypothetical protein